MIVTGAEGLIDPFLLTISELIEHRTQIGHLIVVLDLATLVKIRTALLTVRASHGGLPVKVRRWFVWAVSIRCVRVPCHGHRDPRHRDRARSVKLPRRLPLPCWGGILRCAHIFLLLEQIFYERLLKRTQMMSRSVMVTAIKLINNYLYIYIDIDQ